MTPYEQRCRLLTRVAYPPRFREFRGDELLGPLLDLAEPDQRTPTVRDCWDVLRAGIALRFREHPRLWPWLGYRLLGLRLPWQYRWWARDDIQGRFFYERRFLIGGSLCGLYASWPVLTPNWLVPALLTIAYVLLLPRKAKLRRQWLEAHEFHPDGTPLNARETATMTPSRNNVNRPVP